MVIYSFLTGRLVRKKVDPAGQRVVSSQVDSSQFREASDLFEMEGTNGMPRASIDKLPEVRITKEYNYTRVPRLTSEEYSRCRVSEEINSFIFT